MTRVRQSAARKIATVDVEAGDTVEVELPPGITVAVGERVEVRAEHPGPGWAVPTAR